MICFIRNGMSIKLSLLEKGKNILKKTHQSIEKMRKTQNLIDFLNNMYFNFKNRNI